MPVLLRITGSHRVSLSVLNRMKPNRFQAHRLQYEDSAASIQHLLTSLPQEHGAKRSQVNHNPPSSPTDSSCGWDESYTLLPDTSFDDDRVDANEVLKTQAQVVRDNLGGTLLLRY